MRRLLGTGVVLSAALCATTAAAQTRRTCEIDRCGELVPPAGVAVETVTVVQKQASAPKRIATGVAIAGMQVAIVSLKVITFGAVSLSREIKASSCNKPGALTKQCEEYIVDEAARLRKLAAERDSTRRP